MNATTTRAELESCLRGVAARLVARQIARTAFSGLAGAAAALGLGVVFLDLLPRLLFAAHAGLLPLLLTACAGFVLTAAWELRRYRAPSLQDAALSLEARLPHDSGALAAALRLPDDSAFAAPVFARAADELQQARQAPAPLLIPTRRLVLVPLLALAAGVALVAVVSAQPPRAAQSLPVVGDTPGSSSDWPGVDTGGTRSTADREAYRKALGLKETATQLNRTAAALRDASANPAARETALKDAKQALAASESESSGLSAEEIPAVAPVTKAEREGLADRLEAAATSMQTAAAKLEQDGRSATTDSGKAGEFKPGKARGELVAFPAVETSESAPAEVLAAQTPARRALAERAVKALEGLQNR
jgi:hypothetical protein